MSAKRVSFEELEKCIASLEKKEMSLRIPAAVCSAPGALLDFARRCLLEREQERDVLSSIEELKARVAELSAESCALTLQARARILASRAYRKCSAAAVPGVIQSR